MIHSRNPRRGGLVDLLNESADCKTNLRVPENAVDKPILDRVV